MRSRTLIIGLCAGLAACLAVPAVAADHPTPGHVLTVAADKAAPAPAIVYALRAHDTVDAAILTAHNVRTYVAAIGAPHVPHASATAPEVAGAYRTGSAASGCPPHPFACVALNRHPNADGRTYGTTPASMSLAAHVNANPSAGSGVPEARRVAGAIVAA